MAERPDRVEIDLAGEVVEISWHERDILLEELAWAPETKSIRESFEAVGPSRAEELDAGQRARLRAALDDWGEARLQPEGIARLHAALGRVAS